jgi:hypothetical protein
MKSVEEQPQRIVTTIAALVAVFALSIVLGGALNDGYAQGRDFVSALSARGATQAWVGVVGLLAFSSANALTAWLMWMRSRVVGWLLVVAAASGLIAALARIHCPGGAAGCSLDEESTGDWLDLLHGNAVFVYGVAVVAALGTAAWQVKHRGWRLTFVALAALSVVALALTSSATPGAAQRVWLAANATALLALAMSPLGGGLTRRA